MVVIGVAAVFTVAISVDAAIAVWKKASAVQLIHTKAAKRAA